MGLFEKGFVSVSNGQIEICRRLGIISNVKLFRNSCAADAAANVEKLANKKQ
jgi:hypothetical protein